MPRRKTTLPVLPDELLLKIVEAERPEAFVETPGPNYFSDQLGPNWANVMKYDRARRIKAGFYTPFDGPSRNRNIFQFPTFMKNEIVQKRRVSEVRRKLEHLKLK